MTDKYKDTGYSAPRLTRRERELAKAKREIESILNKLDEVVAVYPKDGIVKSTNIT